jgi:transketolase
LQGNPNFAKRHRGERPLPKNKAARPSGRRSDRINWLCLGIEAGNQDVRLDIEKGRFQDVNIRDVVKMAAIVADPSQASSFGGLGMKNVAFFQDKARQVRRDLLEKFALVKQGHPGSTFSMTDLVVALYYGEYVRKDPKDKSKLYDRVIVSKGHATVSLYPVLTDLGIIPAKEWSNWGHEPSVLRVFGNTKIPGIDATSGSLGHGLGVAAGFALSYKKRKSDRRVFVVISEGELYEGSIWESLLFINHYRLDNLYIVLDRNELIILGNTESCVKLNPIAQKIAAFGFKTFECDGHDFNELLNSLDGMIGCGVPACLIMNTVKGKGVSLMEGKPEWHYWNPLSDRELELCRNDLQ